MTEDAAALDDAAAEDEEADELVDFAEGLDFDKYMDDVEISSMIEQVRDRIKVLEGEEKLSLSRAAVLMRALLKDDGQDYDAILKKAQAQLIDLVRLDDRFELVEGGNARGKPWYYVSRA